MKEWQLILIGFVSLVVVSVIGGVAYRFLEYDNETQTAAIATRQLKDFLDTKTCVDLNDIRNMYDILQLADIAGVKVGASLQRPIENITNWDLQHTVFLAFQVIGSVGFGNAPPRTVGGRVFCVVYILCGIPLFFITALGIGEIIETWIELARGVFYRKVIRRAAPLKGTRAATIFNALSTFIVGGLLFLITPAIVFYTLEDWTFFEAIYSVIMTTLTIGFSDFIPGANAPPSYRGTYRVLVGVWIILDLFWFSSVLVTIKNIFRFSDEIQKPLDVAIRDENSKGENGQMKIRVSKNWQKKHFDKRWKRDMSDKTGADNRVATSITQISPSRVASISDVDVIPVYAPSRLYPAVFSSAVDNRLTVLTPISSLDNNVSRLQVNN